MLLHDIIFVFPLKHKLWRACNVWHYNFGGENLLNLVENWEKNRVYLIGKKTFSI